jgi:hypothetical protein
MHDISKFYHTLLYYTETYGDVHNDLWARTGLGLSAIWTVAIALIWFLWTHSRASSTKTHGPVQNLALVMCALLLSAAIFSSFLSISSVFREIRDLEVEQTVGEVYDLMAAGWEGCVLQPWDMVYCADGNFLNLNEVRAMAFEQFDARVSEALARQGIY